MSPTTVSETTGSKTIADLFRLAVDQYGDRSFVVRKVDDAWVETTFAQSGELVTEIGLGLIDLGLGLGERIGILVAYAPGVDLLRHGRHERRRWPSCRSTRPMRRRSAPGCWGTPKPSP